MVFLEKLIMSVFLTAYVLVGGASAQETDSIANRGRSIDELRAMIEALASSGDEASKAKLRIEGEKLRRSKSENIRILAVHIYQTHLGDAQTAASIIGEIVSTFPDGLWMRNNQYTSIVLNTEDDSPEVLDRKHAEWLKRFPPEHFDEEERDVYPYIHFHLARLLARSGNFERSLYHVKQLKGSKHYVMGVNTYYHALQDKADPTGVALVTDAYRTAVSDASSENEQVRNNAAEPLKVISGTYAGMLFDQGQYQQAVDVLLPSLENVGYSGHFATPYVRVLLDAYSKLGKTAERLAVYERLFVADGIQEEMLPDAKVTYSALKGSGDDFDVWITHLDKQNQSAMREKYQKAMISKKAPSFTLTDRNGATVSLSDYKGKVVVLDFWATWCLPCIASFPGMQAAVDRYRDDPEVEFLFIDTWQREDNYKELVETFMSENLYDFHVLFDEMKDVDKATATAYGVKGIPTKIVIDGNGSICFEHKGSETNVSRLLNELNTMIQLAKERSVAYLSDI